MTKFRRKLAISLLLTVTATTAVVWGICWTRYSLPNPKEADRDGLMRWMVTRDLSKEPYQTRSTLARRLEEEFDAPVDWDVAGRQLDAPQKARLWDNILNLLEPWCMEKVDGYFRLAQADRPAYVDRILDTMESFQAMESIRPVEPTTDEPSAIAPGLWLILLEQFERWKERADPDRREQIAQFQLAVQSRWFMRTLGGA